MRSKGEARIADLLWDNEILYEYESELLDVHPDFLVYTPDGRVCVWEYIGPGMLADFDYRHSLRYKFKSFKQLNPYVYKIALSDTSIEPERVLNDFILKENSPPFFSSLEDFSEEEFLEERNTVSVKALADSLKQVNPHIFHAEKRNATLPTKLWIIDTSSFSYARLLRNDTPLNYLCFHHTNAYISKKIGEERIMSCLVAQEVWELNESGDCLDWINLSNFHPSSTRLNASISSPCRIPLMNGDGSIASIVNAYFNRQEGTIRKRYSPESEIREVLESQPGKQSQIQLLVDASQFEYSDLEKPYEHLTGIRQKKAKLPPETRQQRLARKGRAARTSILRFEIVFEDSPLFVDIYGKTKIDLEMHLRELEIKRYQFNSSTRLWTAVQPTPHKGRKPARERKNRLIGVDQASPNLQSASEVLPPVNTVDSALPPIAPGNLLPPVAPSTLEKPKLKNERQPEPKAQNAEQTEQNTPGTGKNHPRNRRRKEIKRLKQALEPYPDLKAVFETEVLPQDLEELTTIAKYYYLKIKYKNNQAL